MSLARFARIARQRLRSLFRGRTQDAELDRELSFHLDAVIEEKLAEGLSLDEARAAARRDFGNLTLFREQSLDARGVRWLGDIRQDCAYGWRMFRKYPGMTAIAIASLAIGIGANTAVWAAARALLIVPLPFADADRLVAIRAVSPDGTVNNAGATLTEYFAWHDRNVTLDALGGSWSGPRELNAEPDGPPAERPASQAFTPSLFALLGVPAAQGRLFEDTNNAFSPAARVVVISDGLWQRRYGRQPDIIGRTIHVQGAPRTVIGVMPPAFRYQDDNVAFWIPFIPGPDARRDPGAARILLPTARLKPGVTEAQAQADLNVIESALAAASPDRFRGWTIRVVPLRDVMYGWTRPVLFTLMAAVGLVLLVACANVAGLLLARAAARDRELWMRVALGAGRGRIVRQLLTESLMLAFAGGAFGAGVAAAGLRLLSATMGPPPGQPRVGVLHLDLTMLGVTSLLSMGTALAFGTWPALAATRAWRRRRDPGGAPTTRDDRRAGRVRHALVAVQLAIATIVIAGAGLLLKSFVLLAARDLNLDAGNLLSFEYTVSIAEYTRTAGPPQGQGAFTLTGAGAEALQRVHARLAAVPGVESAAGISYAPVNSLIVPRFAVAAADRPVASGTVTCAYFIVTPRLFATMRTPIVRGRDFGPDDREGTPEVVVINESAARRLWPDADAIGRHLTLDMGLPGRAPEVIGVVRDVPIGRGGPPEPIVYAPFLQPPPFYRGKWIGMFGEMTFIVRPSGDAATVLAAVRRAVADVDPTRGAVNAGTLLTHLDARMPERRNYVLALAGFGGTAVFLGGIGVYGVVAFAVAARTREVGIRRVLGAGRGEIMRAIAARALALVALGVLPGLAAARACSGLIVSQLWGIGPTDPTTFLTAAIIVAGVAALACVAPVRRALGVEPASVLRAE